MGNLQDRNVIRHGLHKPYKCVVHVFFVVLGMTLDATLVDNYFGGKVMTTATIKMTANPVKRASMFNSALTNWKRTGDGQADTWRRYYEETGENPLVVYENIEKLGFAIAVPLPFSRPYAAYGTYRFAVSGNQKYCKAYYDKHYPHQENEFADWESVAPHNGLYWLPYGGDSSKGAYVVN